VSGIDSVLAHAGEAPVIGTSSVRRVAQLSALLPRATFAAIRGNVDTRLRKLDAGPLAAIVLAAAGLRRLGLASRISATIPIDRCVPAPGQGIVAIETRADDEAFAVLHAINDPLAAAALAAERAVVSALGGGCQLPLGAIALHEDGELHMHGVVVSPDGRRVIRREARGAAAAPEALGARLAEELGRGGGADILDEVRRLE
jgi:hydroxymethylbilane synthase